MNQNASPILFEGFYTSHIHRIFVMTKIQRACICGTRRGQRRCRNFYLRISLLSWSSVGKLAIRFIHKIYRRIIISLINLHHHYITDNIIRYEQNIFY